MSPVVAEPGSAAPPAARPAAPIAAPQSAAAGVADPLAELRGLHLPEPIGFWPPAPGWWALAGMLLLSALGLCLWQRRRRRSIARQALRELDGLATAGTSDDVQSDVQSLATAISALLRRVALLRFGRARVAPLHGPAWRDFLTETAPRSRRGASRALDAGLLLSLAPYAPAGAPCLTLAGGTLDRQGLLAAARAWIKENA